MPQPKQPYRIHHVSAAGDILHRTEDDADPFVRETRCLLQADDVFARGQAKERAKTLESCYQIHEEHKRAIPNHLRASVRAAEVTRGDAHRAGSYYHAYYRIEPLPFVPVTLSIPLGDGLSKYGDFTEWEGQPFLCEWAHDPWEPGFLFVALRETTPFSNDSPEECAFGRALARARWPQWNRQTNRPGFGIHLLGQNLSYARAWAEAPRIRPAAMRAGKPSPKGRRA